MFEPRDGRDSIGARLTVASSDAGVLQATNFWPRPMLGHGILTLYG